MGNVFRKKRIITEELESLSAQMNDFRTDIEHTFQRRKSILWYTTFTVFFVTTSLTAYIFMAYNKQEYKIVFSILSLVGGIITLYLLRRVVNAYYDYMVTRKRKNLDTIIEKKKQILENVKETETFKVAKEILEKYDDEAKLEIAKPSSHPSTPMEIRKNMPVPAGPPGRNGPNPKTPALPQQRPMGAGPGPIGNGPRPATSLGNINQQPQNVLMGPPRRLGPPPRPFVKESKNAMDKVVDYFFGDGPNNRFALICNNCHGHNGMAFPGEFEYLAFVCFICGQFNPAKKLRPAGPSMNRPSMAVGELNLLRKPLQLKEEVPHASTELDILARPPSTNSQESLIDSEKIDNVTDDDFEDVTKDAAASEST